MKHKTTQQFLSASIGVKVNYVTHLDCVIKSIIHMTDAGNLLHGLNHRRNKIQDDTLIIFHIQKSKLFNFETNSIFVTFYSNKLKNSYNFEI